MKGWPSPGTVRRPKGGVARRRLMRRTHCFRTYRALCRFASETQGRWAPGIVIYSRIVETRSAGPAAIAGVRCRIGPDLFSPFLTAARCRGAGRSVPGPLPADAQPREGAADRRFRDSDAVVIPQVAYQKGCGPGRGPICHPACSRVNGRWAV